MSDQREVNPKIAAFALQKLRDASEQIPAASKREGLGGLLREVKEANEKIAKCEKSYQEKADVLNKTIAHSISNFVDKEVIEMDAKLKNPPSFNPADDASMEEAYKELMVMKKKLVYLFELVSRWGWSHLRQVQRERIAEVYERIDTLAANTEKILKEEIDHASSSVEKERFIKFQERFQSILAFGSDRINPDEIFAEG